MLVSGSVYHTYMDPMGKALEWFFEDTKHPLLHLSRQWWRKASASAGGAEAFFGWDFKNTEEI